MLHGYVVDAEFGWRQADYVTCGDENPVGDHVIDVVAHDTILSPPSTVTPHPSTSPTLQIVFPATRQFVQSLSITAVPLLHSMVKPRTVT